MSIVGIPWLLSSGLDVDGWEEAPPSAVFMIDTVGGFGGCNRFTAPYTIDGDGIEIGAIASTRMACPPPADEVERAYLAALEQVAGWRVEEDGAELALLADDGAELLRYAQGSPVGDWEVTSFSHLERALEPSARHQDHRELRRRRQPDGLGRLQHLHVEVRHPRRRHRDRLAVVHREGVLCARRS